MPRSAFHGSPTTYTARTALSGTRRSPCSAPTFSHGVSWTTSSPSVLVANLTTMTSTPRIPGALVAVIAAIVLSKIGTWPAAGLRCGCDSTGFRE